MSNRGECADYFKEHPEYHRCLKAILQKWKTYGKASGQITLPDTSEEERRAIGGILGKTFQEETIRFSVSAFERGLQKTRFAPIDLEEVLREYFGNGISTNRETRQDAADRKRDFLERICGMFEQQAGDGVAYQWMRELADEKNHGYQILMREYARNPEQTERMAENVGKALESLETAEKRPLAVFAALVTGNPHYFDRGTTAGQLLMHGICWRERKNFPSNAHDWRILLNQAGIIPDQISSIVHAYGLRLKTENGWHPAYEAFYARGEAFVLTIANLCGITECSAPGRKAYVVENEMVFSYLVDQCRGVNAAILCTSGQLRSAALKLIGMLLENDHQVYYSGDLDPDGICIADRLWQKYGVGIRIWRMAPDDYPNSVSQENISLVGIAKLEHVCHPVLRETAQLVRERRKAGYQENILEDLKNDIICNGHRSGLPGTNDNRSGGDY